MMGGWFLATSIGNKISGIFGEVYASEKFFGLAIDHQTFWSALIAINLMGGVVVFVLLPWLNRQMAGTEE